MRIDILTLFPSMFTLLEESIIGKARSKGILDIVITDIRKFSKDKHHTADDTPYGGGAGMVMKPDLILEALDQVKLKFKSKKSKIICQKSKAEKIVLLSPAGKTFDQKMAQELSKCDRLVLICGHYEGVDERIKDIIDEDISIGDFVLTGGEPAAIVLIDAVSRLVPGVLGNDSSSKDESFSHGLLEYPQYTKPVKYLEKSVPEVLLSGNHKNIAKWRREKAVVDTFFKRPDLLALADITSSDMGTLENLFTEGQK